MGYFKNMICPDPMYFYSFTKNTKRFSEPKCSRSKMQPLKRPPLQAAHLKRTLTKCKVMGWMEQISGHGFTGTYQLSFPYYPRYSQLFWNEMTRERVDLCLLQIEHLIERVFRNGLLMVIYTRPPFLRTSILQTFSSPVDVRGSDNCLMWLCLSKEWHLWPVGGSRSRGCGQHLTCRLLLILYSIAGIPMLNYTLSCIYTYYATL